MLDLKAILNEKMFLGQEFLTWLWWLCEQETPLELEPGRPVELLLGDRLLLGPVQGREGTRLTVKGSEQTLAEAREGLRRGKLVESLKLGLLVDGEEMWLNLKAADLGVSGLKLPPVRGGEGDERDEAGLWLERIALIDLAVSTLDALFQRFIEQRVAPGPENPLRAVLKEWIETGG